MYVFSCYGPHRDLHSFPTRRSSDLERQDRDRQEQAVDEHEVGVGDQVGRVLGARCVEVLEEPAHVRVAQDRKSTRLNSSHVEISYAVFCLKKKKITY